MSTPASLIEELERTLASGTNEQRTQALARITDLFVASAGRYSAEQIGLFDDVILRIAARIEAKTLAKLSSRLATVANAPAKVMKQLAFHDDIAVARPVLSLSDRLDDNDLVVNAKTKGQEHLLAISERKAISEIVTDVLVERGNKDVVRSVAKNSGARFSDAGFRVLVNRSNGDDVLATHVGMRRDVPRHHFLKLLAKASQTVRLKLEAEDQLNSKEIHRAVAAVAGHVQTKSAAASRNYAAARSLVSGLGASKQLGESQVEGFAKAHQFEETTVALALLCDLPVEAVERAMIQDRSETILIMARAAGLSWPTAKAVLLLRAGDRGLAIHELEQCLASFARLKLKTAQEIVRFQRKRWAEATRHLH